MYNTKFILKNGQFLYPGYFSKENRAKLRERYKNEREFMKCGCRPEAELFYRISEDGKIYPEHNNYEHENTCSRYKDANGNTIHKNPYSIDEETGDVTAILKFNPKNFSVSQESGLTDDCQDSDTEKVSDEETEDEELIIEGEKSESKPNEEKDEKLSLENFIRKINIDSFSERVLNGKDIFSKTDFQKFVYGRMHKINVPPMRKSLADLSLEKDGVRFFYLPVKEICIDDSAGYNRCSIKTVFPDGKTYSNFIYEKTLANEIKKFSKKYGINPQNVDNLMIAGFQYLKKTKSGSTKKSYRVLGRIHLFLCSDSGIYCRTNTEQEIFNALDLIKNEHPDFKYWIPTEDDSVEAIISIGDAVKKIMVIFRGKKSFPVDFERNIFVPVVADNPGIFNYDYLKNLIETE